MKNIFFLIFLFTIVFGGVVSAQNNGDYHTKNKKAVKAFESALRYYRLQQDEEAYTQMDLALKADSNFLEVWMLKGQMKYERHLYEEAAVNFEKVIAIDSLFSPMPYYYLADAYLNLLEVEKARNYLKIFLHWEGLSSIKKKKGEALLALADYRQQLINNPVDFNPVNLGPGVNGPWYEHSPTLTVDEQILYFTRNAPTGAHYGNGQPHFDEDLFLSYRDKSGNWQKAENLGPEINTQYREGASAISPDGKYLFFTSCGNPKGIGSCDLYLAVKKGDSWTKPKNLGSTVNRRSWDSQPAFAPDGRTLYFVSNRDNRTKKDIYVTQIGNDGKWSTPVKISINTEGNDESPFIHPDGETFYFSSDGYPGMGMRDLFMSKIDSNGNFGEPVNLGYPINSIGDEVSLVVSANGKTAYYASGMEGGYGEWDLYSFELPEEIRPVVVNYAKGKVYDANTKKPLRARFELINLETGKIMVESFSDGITGEFLVVVPTGKDMALNVSAKNYLFFSQNYQFNDSTELKGLAFDVPLKPIEVGETVVLNNIFFEFNSYELKPASKVELDKLISFLNANPTLRIEIGGHTDNKGSRDYNQKLSENRAKSVLQYLEKHGIDGSRLEYKGYNFAIPIATNDTDEGRALNRRTEFKIL